MARARLRKKKKESVMTVGGKIITAFFILLFLGGGYFLFTLFRPIEINSINITGEWRLVDDYETVFFNFQPTGGDNMSGTCEYYHKQAGTGLAEDKVEYDYVLFMNDKDVMELHMTAKKHDEIVMKITSLSNAQMGVIHHSTKMANMTKTNLF